MFFNKYYTENSNSKYLDYANLKDPNIIMLFHYYQFC